eukprot:TRINITY_DN23386_c0_g1_i1.p1 TRINITY_DN23386_c0_g1~~TRINITY_DN23386_c0_g1_i1.p1  ORF type:complete len:309 (-),score=28.22 TRINITY_DN23386_c0_g1_i1:159-1085(-)
MKAFVAVAAVIAVVLAQDKDKFCGVSCHNNAECNVNPSPMYPDPCSFCDHTEKICKPGLPCDSACVVDSDCNQNGQCNMCTNGICSSNGGCRAYCDAKIPCGEPCSECDNNRCVAPCGGPCHHRSSTRTNGSNTCSESCGLCLPDPQHGCGAALCCRSSFCDAGCKNDTDCGGDCSMCNPTFGRCVKPGCGSECAQDTDCVATGGRCQTCYKGMCTSNCGGHCSTAADCGADCSECEGSRCIPGACNATCLTNSGCAGPSCSFCSNGSCSRGLACGAVCHNDLDCDQTGACSICPRAAGKDTGVCTTP